MLVEPFPFWRQRDPPVGADKQFAAQLVLKVVHYPCDVGLVVVQELRRPGKALTLRNRVENAVVIVGNRNVHLLVILILYGSYIKNTFYILSQLEYTIFAPKMQVWRRPCRVRPHVLGRERNGKDEKLWKGRCAMLTALAGLTWGGGAESVMERLLETSDIIVRYQGGGAPPHSPDRGRQLPFPGFAGRA